MPKVSVLVPIYNSEKYLFECLKSIQNQTLKDIEIILINDGSTDNSKEIIKNFIKNDKRFILIDKKNTGYGNSLNIGINKSKSNYLAIVESDDFIAPDMLKILYSTIKTTNSDIVKSDFYYLKNKKIKKYNLFKKLNTNFFHNIETTPQILTLKPSVWSAIYKKDLIFKNGIFFDNSNSKYQDTSFQFLSMYCAKKIFFIDDALYYYRIDNPSSSINKDEDVYDISAQFDIINSYIENNFINTNAQNQKILFELRAYLWNLNRINKKYKKEFVDKISETMKNYELEYFYKDKKIPKKEKLKIWLLIHFKYLFLFLFNISKTMQIKRFILL